MAMSTAWLALVIGNTRLHWGYFDQGELLATWHTCHLCESAFRLASQLTVTRTTNQPYSQPIWQLIEALASQSEVSSLGTPLKISLVDRSLPIALWIASVVPEQTRLWTQAVPDAQIVRRSRIPLKNIYPTLGIDRAINLLGAKQTLGFPALVIDSGTALTMTAGAKNAVYGGAILPGMTLQLESLGQQTAQLGSLLPIAPLQKQSSKARLTTGLPARWATDSEGAIASGIAYSLTSTCIDYITDWWQQFPTGAVVCTGGDGPLLHQYIQQRTPEIASRVLVDSDLMFRGMQAYRSELTT